MQDELFKEKLWYYKFNRHKATLKWNLKAALLVYGVVNIWAVYKRVEFYMEHSFDLLNPNIDYLKNRF